MSATYKCNFCNKKITEHSKNLEEIEWLANPSSKKKDDGISEIIVKVKVSTRLEQWDICESCAKEAIKKATKKLCKRL